MSLYPPGSHLRSLADVQHQDLRVRWARSHRGAARRQEVHVRHELWLPGHGQADGGWKGRRRGRRRGKGRRRRGRGRRTRRRRKAAGQTARVQLSGMWSDLNCCQI